MTEEMTGVIMIEETAEMTEEAVAVVETEAVEEEEVVAAETAVAEQEDKIEASSHELRAVRKEIYC